MAHLTLYHAPRTRSSAVLWMLEETGEPYELRLVDLAKEENRAPAYLAVNPMGKVPALDHDGTIITETAAICCYLGDRFGLGVALDDPRRGAYLSWLFFAAGCLEPACLDAMLGRAPGPPNMMGWGSLERAVERVARPLRDGPYLMGEQFTAADVVVGSILRWALAAGSIPIEDGIEDYVRRLDERPALRRAEDKDAAFIAAAQQL